MSQNNQTPDELVNNFINQESDRAITLIRSNNLLQGSSLTFLNPEQKQAFIRIVKEYYIKKFNNINLPNDDFELIFYNPFEKKFIVPLSENSGDAKMRHFIPLTFEQFITAIVHSLIIGIFKIDSIKRFFTTNFWTGESILTQSNDEQRLKKFYPYVTGKIYLEMISDPLMGESIIELSNSVATEGLLVNPNFRPTDLTTYEVTGDLPRPPTPPGGWPSDKLGGKKYRKTNRKRKSKSKSKSKKRYYKSRSYRRIKRNFF